MANYATLKAAIQAVIYENGNQEITGEVMQATLLTMVNSLGANFQYAGIATPTTDPGTPDQNVFYLAATAGTYANFSNIVLEENEVAVLKYNGTWQKDITGLASNDRVNSLSQLLINVVETEEPYSSDNYTSIPFVINTSNSQWATVNTSTGCRYRAVTKGQKVTITANSTRATSWAFLASEPTNIVAGQSANFADSVGLRSINAGQTDEAIVPVDCFLYVRYRTPTLNANYFPSSIVITTYNEVNKVEEWDATTQNVNSILPYLSQGKNLLDPSKARDKYRLANTSPYKPTPSNNWWLSDYVDVHNVSVVFFGFYTPAYIAFYDANKEYVSGYQAAQTKTPIEVPTGAYYMLASWGKANAGVTAYRPVEYEDRYKAGIYEWLGFDNNATFKELNGANIRYLPNWKIDMNTLLPYAANAEERTFTQDVILFVPRGQFSAIHNMIFTAFAKYTNNVDEAKPTIQFQCAYNSSLSSSGIYNQVSYISPEYVIGAKDELTRKSWRIPRLTTGVEFIKVKISIPTNVVLTIYDFGNFFESHAPIQTKGVRFNAHGAFGVGRFNTVQGVEAAAMVGAPTCVVVPKKTADGVWVCFHDDATVNGDLVYEDGSAAPASPVSSLTWAQLQTMRYQDTSYRHTFSGYIHVSKLEECLAVCAKTGIAPMFSVHPYPDADGWQELKLLVSKYGLLRDLHIKVPLAGASNLGVAYSVFGNDIASYGVDVSTDVVGVDTVLGIGIDNTKVRVFIEYFDNKVTESKVTTALNAGLAVAIYNSTHTMNGADYEKWMALGVDEFTTEMLSNGLNW